MRNMALFALLVALSAAPALAQPVAGSLDDVYKTLQDLQDANLGIARQMAALEQQAANELEGAIEVGAIVNPVNQAIARTFVSNARTLAAIMLSPMQTYQTAAGESMFVLVRRNIDLIKGIMNYRAADASLDQAITRYTVLQMQTQDMAMALQNGWTRYGEILTAAERNGLLASNTFDPDTQSWSIGTPVVGGTADVAAITTPTAPATVETVVPTAEPAPLSASVTPLVVPTLPEPTTTTTEVAVATPPAEPAPAERLPAAPEPQLTGQPNEPAPAPQAETPVATAGHEQRLTPNGPLEVAAVAPTTVQMGDWTVTTDADGDTTATAVNLVGETRETIASLEISCGPDRGVAYVINADREFPAFRVFADRSQNVTVEATNGNIIAAEPAQAVTETLQAAVAWAQQVPDSGRSLTFRTADAEGVLALFPPRGYLDAYAAVGDACAHPGTVPMPAINVPEVPALPAAEIAPVATAAPGEPVAEAPAEEPAAAAEAETPKIIAPVPAPRLDRSQLPTQAPLAAPRPGVDQPINIM